jgi:large subunit ribosomal protein L22
MLSATKLKNLCKTRSVSASALAGNLVRGGLDAKMAMSAVKNWQKGLMKPKPASEDLRRIATALNVDVTDVSEWACVYKYAPGSARKARLVTEMIPGLSVQNALDTLKFAQKRAASMAIQVLKSAIANADEQGADVEKLFVKEAYVDDAGLRLGTKQWRAKDRGRAHSIRKTACHIHIVVAEG